jgi:tellurite resistance protein
MVSVSAADGDLDEAELATISTIVYRLTGQYLDANTIVDLAAEMRKADTPIGSTIAELRGRLSPDFDVLIARACYLVATADGDVSDVEERRLIEILRGLRLTKQQIAEVTEEARG